MLIKIVHKRRKAPRRPADLRRLLRYLFTPKLSRDPLPSPPRLLGPPVLHRLVTSALPWGPGVEQAAADLTEQMVDYCRDARAGLDMPGTWYVHMIVSFSPKAAPALRNPPDGRPVPPSNRSQSANALRVVFDVLDCLGWHPLQPGVFVCHGDRRHIHVHAVIVRPVEGGGLWDIMRMSRKRLWEIAQIGTDAFGLPGAGRTAAQHQGRWLDFEHPDKV